MLASGGSAVIEIDQSTALAHAVRPDDLLAVSGHVS
jgi:hypothetical protein